MKSNLRLFGIFISFWAFLGISLIAAPSAHAALSPLGVSIIPPVEFPPEDFAVTGVRVSALWGKHRNIYGFDFGLVGNVTEQNMVGIGVSGLFNLNEGASTILGLQLAGGANINVNKTQIFGLQVAGGINSNQAESTVVGVQLAALSNYSPFTKVYGVQVSLYNNAREVNGFQIGLLNVADSLHGIQIGLVNVNRTGLFAFAPILNIGF